MRHSLGQHAERIDAIDQDQLAGQAGAGNAELAPGETELVVAIGSRATQIMFETMLEQPLLSVLVPKITHDTLLARFPDDSAHASRAAIYIDQPAQRQIALARTLLPQAEVAGLMIGTELASQEDTLVGLAEAFSLRLNLVELAADDDPARGIKQVLPGSDLVLALYDPVVLKPLTAKWLLYMAYQRRIPVIAFSQGYLKAGAVAAVFSTPEQIGRQAGQTIMRWTEETHGNLGNSRFPFEFEIGFNRAVAESLELTLPSIEATRKRMTMLMEDDR
jgi:ABC-type uncharacterized transport system substrate-binding protein